jgi:hypothetical protein
MRAWLGAFASTLGSAAFQMSVDAGYFHNFKWAIPWTWALSLALWMFLATSYPPVKERWLKSFHDFVGGWIHAIRLVICAVVFVVVGLGASFAMRDKRQTQIAATQTMPAPSFSQAADAGNQSPPSQQAQPPAKPKSKKSGPAPQVQENSGTNDTNTQIGTAQGPVVIAPSGIANAAPNLGNQTVTNNFVTPAPTGNLSTRCEAMGKTIGAYADRRAKMEPEKKEENVHEYFQWIEANDIVFRRDLGNEMGALLRELSARADNDFKLDELLERSRHVIQYRNGVEGMQTCKDPQFPECYLSLDEIRAIGERFTYLSTNKL